jgi:Fe-S-cluster-containing dehydrogenase component
MKKWNLIIDVDLCENCNNCMLVTKDEHVGNDFPGYAATQPLHGHYWIKIERNVRGNGSMIDAANIPVMCNHCDNAPCIKAAGDKSVYKRNDGIVIIDPIKSKGRKDLIESCPYGAMWWNDELKIPQIWIFDAHLLDQGWPTIRIVQTCPTTTFQALQVEDAEMADMVKKQGLDVLKPELDTRPRVYYKNYYRFSKCFIGGSVVSSATGVKESLANVEAVLYQNGKAIQKMNTDEFGDFKFDKLCANSGNYTVELIHNTLGKRIANVDLKESVYIGSIYFD